MPEPSVAFDRAAEYYDATRGLSPDGVRATTDALVGVFGASPGRVLEVGVGTGQLAVPLHERGVSVAGIDLSRPMLRKLVDKTNGAVAFPLVEGDATRMPFPDDAFDGAYLRWVLHLIPDWRAAVDEIVRVVRHHGTFLAALGSYGGAMSEIQARFAEVTGISTEPAGLTWDGWGELDRAIAALGGTKLPDVVLEDEARDDMETFVRGMESNSYSWTWAVRDDELRQRAAAEARRWAEERFGPLDAVPRERFEFRFARYRLG